MAWPCGAVLSSGDDFDERDVEARTVVTKAQSKSAATQTIPTDTGAAIHPTFLRIGPWALSVVVAVLFGLAFATSYAALRDYAYELQFTATFARAFPLVLDAVIVVLAVTLLLERALGPRAVTLAGRQMSTHAPTWPLLTFWLYFAASVAGNVGHAPQLLAAQLVAAVPPVSAALTFHLLLRLLDRAPLLRRVAEQFEDRTIDEQIRSATRRARRDELRARAAVAAKWEDPSRPTLLPPQPPNGLTSAGSGRKGTSLNNGHRPASDLHERVREAEAAGERVTGETVAEWLGVSVRTGRRRLAASR